MAAVEIAPDKILAYCSTDYRIIAEETDVILRVGEYASQLNAIFGRGGSRCGVFITAYNPFGKAQDIVANQRAQNRLEEQLKEVAAMVLAAEGADPTGAWPPEPSFFAVGVDESLACALGSQFHQDAVVWVGDNLIPRLLITR